MSGKLPVDTVLAFLEQINAGNADGLCALVTEDHLLVDGLGNRLQGRAAMRKGWAGYFRMFPDYRVSHADVVRNAGRQGRTSEGAALERAGNVASRGA